jgi:hypothetical protein
MKKLLLIFMLLTITVPTHAQWRKSLEYDLKTPLDVLPEVKKNEDDKSIAVTNVSKRDSCLYRVPKFTKLTSALF